MELFVDSKMCSYILIYLSFRCGPVYFTRIYFKSSQTRNYAVVDEWERLEITQVVATYKMSFKYHLQ